MASRIGAMIVGVLIALYASYSWARWNPFSQFLRGAWISIDTVIAVILLVGVAVFFAWTVFRSPQSSDYLIDMDDELRKVVWPGVMPLFDPKTEAWGSTYVVIVCAIIFTVFISIADKILEYAIMDVLFTHVLFAG